MHEPVESGVAAVALVLTTAVLFSIRLFLSVSVKIRKTQRLAAEAVRVESAASEEYASKIPTFAYRNLAALVKFSSRHAALPTGNSQTSAEGRSSATIPSVCVVCFTPASKRCSRCKEMKYCSTKCQIQHWRKGHKQDCCVPAVRSMKNKKTSHAGKVLESSRFTNSTSLDNTVISITRPDIAKKPRASALASPNETLPKPSKILFPYEYFVDYFNCTRLPLPPCGLINCGNSCFANVVLQCLTHTRPLAAYLLQGSHAQECFKGDWCFMCELQRHVWRVRESQRPFSPITILSQIQNIGKHLGYGRQEDAHEFMRFAIDSMQSICLEEVGGEKSMDPRTQETTFIQHIFGGHLQSQVKCLQCHHESDRYENIMDLAVEIQGNVKSLEDALAHFTAPEWLDGENKYKCERCCAYVKARKRLTVHEAPNILTIALKRFQFGDFGKLNKRVTFPEVLDMSPYMSGMGDEPPHYQLYAVVVHLDISNACFFGHYICYVKDQLGLWYKIDDSKVKEVNLDEVMKQKAYMLLYKRSLPRPAPITDDGMCKSLTSAHADDFCQSELTTLSNGFLGREPDLPVSSSLSNEVFNGNRGMPSLAAASGVINGGVLSRFLPEDNGYLELLQTHAGLGILSVKNDSEDYQSVFPKESSHNHYGDGMRSLAISSMSTLCHLHEIKLTVKVDTDCVRYPLKNQSSWDCPEKTQNKILEIELTPLPTPRSLDTDILITCTVASRKRLRTCSLLEIDYGFSSVSRADICSQQENMIGDEANLLVLVQPLHLRDRQEGDPGGTDVLDSGIYSQIEIKEKVL